MSNGGDLAARLLAAIEETERVARAATDGPWTAYATRGVFAGVLDRDWVAGTDPAEAEHIARHDPAAVLRRCEADRRIVEYCEMTLTDKLSEAPESCMADSVLEYLADGYGLEVETG